MFGANLDPQGFYLARSLDRRRPTRPPTRPLHAPYTLPTRHEVAPPYTPPTRLLHAPYTPPYTFPTRAYVACRGAGWMGPFIWIIFFNYSVCHCACPQDFLYVIFTSAHHSLHEP